MCYIYPISYPLTQHNKQDQVGGALQRCPPTPHERPHGKLPTLMIPGRNNLPRLSRRAPGRILCLIARVKSS